VTRPLVFVLLPYFLLLGAGCARVSTGEGVRLSSVPVYGGFNWGGVTVHPSYVPASLYSQPRRMYSAGAHAEFEVKGHPVETGLDWHVFDHMLNYAGPLRTIEDRRLEYSQLRVPLTYNLDLLRDSSGLPVADLKLGMSGGYTAILRVSDRGIAEGSKPYTFTRCDAGPQLGFVFYLSGLRFSGLVPGLFLDAYVGTIIYSDDGMARDGYGRSNYLRAGLTARTFER
jgi:hypothetical protein